jgi:hypothetical protein
MELESSTKTINLSNKKTNGLDCEKLVRKATNKWRFENKNLDFMENLYILQKKDELNEVQEEIRRQINYKINSYKGQDVKKGLLLESDFVDYDYVLNLLIDKQLKCFYCRDDVLLLYNYVRENKQWTLERIDNKIGHNRGNVEIACLLCNLRRRTMYHERYVFTKQLCVVKMDE